MSLLKQSLLVSGSRLADKLLSLILVLVLSRHFGKEGLGEFNYFFSLANLAAPIMNISVGMILLQQWYTRDDAARRLLLTQLLVVTLVSGLLPLGTAIAADHLNQWR